MYKRIDKATRPNESPMKKSFKSLGEELHQRRNELNISLKEAANSTSIRLSHLQALEQGEMSKLISPVYAQGFYKQYANFLGFDGEKLARENVEIFSNPEKQEFAYGIGTIEMRGNPGGGVKMIPNAVWGVAFVAVAVAAWYAAKFLELI